MHLSPPRTHITRYPPISSLLILSNNIWCGEKWHPSLCNSVTLYYVKPLWAELGFIWPVSFSFCAQTHNFSYEKPLSQSGCSMSCLRQAFSVVLLVFKDYKGCMLATSRWLVFVSKQFLSIFLCNYVTVCLNYNVVTFVHYSFTQWHAPPRTARLHT